MKKLLLIGALLLSSMVAFAGLNYPKGKSLFLKEQAGPKKAAASEFGNTLNVGLGIGYNGYRGVPVMINYELDVAKNFTLAPFIGFGTYSYYGGKGYYNKKGQWVGDEWRYRGTYIPIGVKGTFYFDELLGLIDPLDIYAGASIGFTYWHWSSNYDDFNRDDYNSGTSALWLALHLGIEYHFNQKVGIFLDASTGMSTIGLSFKM